MPGCPAGIDGRVGGVTVVDAGQAWFEPGGTTGGTVAGVFRRAAYLRFGTRLLAVCGPDVDPGPLHLRLDRLPTLATGAPATLVAGRLAAGPVRVALVEQHRWTPAAVDPSALRAAPAPERGAGANAGLPPHVVAEAGRLVDRGDLSALAALVGGRGPGLTPSGDDLLAGVLVVDATLRPVGEAARRHAAAAAVTTDVAAAFLRWAAVGLSIGPVHDLLAARAGRRPDVEAIARHRLCQVGASSGAALLLGLDLALSAGARR